MFERNVDKASHDAWRRYKQQPPPFIIAPLVGYKWDDGWSELGNRATCGAWGRGVVEVTLTRIALISESTLTRIAPVSETNHTRLASISAANIIRITSFW